MLLEKTTSQNIIKKLAQILAIYPQLTEVRLSVMTNSDTLTFDFDSADICVSVPCKMANLESQALNLVVNAKTLVDYLSALSDSDITLTDMDGYLKVSSDRSKYKVAILNASSTAGPTFNSQETVNEFTLSQAIIDSIAQINLKEFSRNKASKNPVNQLYYVSGSGCFNAANNFGACLNLINTGLSTELLISQPLLKLLSISSLDWACQAQQNQVHDIVQNVIQLRNADMTIKTYQPADPKIRSTLVTMFSKMKQLTTAFQPNVLYINVAELAKALSRLALAAKHNSLTADGQRAIKVVATEGQLTLMDTIGNIELLDLLPETTLIGSCTFGLILKDLQAVIAACKADQIKIATNASMPAICEFESVKYILANIAE